MSEPPECTCDMLKYTDACPVHGPPEPSETEMPNNENAARAERAEEQAAETLRLFRLGLSSYRLIDEIPLLCETINDLAAALRRESERPAFRSELFEQLEGRHERPE